MNPTYHLTRTLVRGAVVILLMLAVKAVSGQAGPRNGALTIDIRAGYDIWPSDAKLSLRDIYTLEQAKAKHPDLWRAAAVDKLSDAQVMAFTLFEAAVVDATWKNGQYQADTGYPNHGGLLMSRNDIKIPNGAYLVTRTLEYSTSCSWVGSGAGTGNPNNGGHIGDTEIGPWLERWAGDPKNVVVMRAYAHGSDKFDAYSEGIILRDFRINGHAGKWHNPAQAISGLIVWDAGEVSDVSNLFITLCDTGLNIVRGTPFNCSGTMSLFSNNVVGLKITGGGSVNIHTLSMDDNARAVWSTSGYGRKASVHMNVGLVKSEWYITDPVLGRTPKTNAWVMEGWTHLNVGKFNHCIGPAYQDALFVVKPDVNASHIKVGDFSLFAGEQLGVVLRDVVNREAWAMDNGWSSGVQEFRWTSIGGGNLESWPTQATPIPYTAQNYPLGYLKGDPVTGAPVGVIDRTAGTPTWSDVTGSSTAPVAGPVACAYTYSSWSTCTAGMQSRTVVSASPTGCTGTPITSQPCTTEATKAWATTFAGSGPNLVGIAPYHTIAPATAAQAGTFASGAITTKASTVYPWSRGTATRVVFTGITITGPFSSYPHITANHVLYPDGRVMYRATYTDPSGDRDTGVKVVAGTKYATLTLPCPGGVLGTVLGRPDGGNGAVMTIEGMEVW